MALLHFFKVKVLRHILTFASLLLTFIVSAQEKGVFSLDATLEGLGSLSTSEVRNDRISSNQGLLDVKAKYTKPRFYIETQVKGELKSIITEVVGMSFNVSEGKEKLLMDYTGNDKDSRYLTLSAGGGYLPTDRDEIKFKYTYSGKFDWRNNSTMTLNLMTNPMQVQGSEEDATAHKSTNVAEGSWLHKFETPGRELEIKGAYEYDYDDRYDIWTIGESLITYDWNGEDELDYEVSRMYRLTPTYVDNKARINTRFSAKDFCGVEHLDVDYHLNGLLKVDRDVYEAANFVEEEWQDSVRYRADFDYLSLTVDPVARLKYSVGNFSFDGQIVPEYFNYRLNDSKHTGRLDSPSVTLLAQITNTWKPLPGHTFSLNAKRDIKRPDYLQMCWFQRPGTLKDELMEGNTGLLPTLINTFNFNYTYNLKRFSTVFEAGHEYRTRDIEKTFHSETIGGRLYRVYTWINSGHSYKTNLKLTAKWNGSRLKADLMGNVNFFRGFNAAGALTQSSDWECRANASFDWGKGWMTKAAARYQSKIIRSYTSITEYVGLDIVLSKQFRNGWKLYISGNDLLDRMMEVTTISEDGNQGRLEQQYLNRRCLKLGVNYKF